MGRVGRATLLAAIAFAAGILAGPVGPAGLIRILIPVALLLITLILIKTRTPERLRVFSLLILWISLGWGIGQPSASLPLPDERVWVEGTVRIPFDSFEDRTRYRLTIHRWFAGTFSHKLDTGAVMTVPDSVVLTPGEDVLLIARLYSLDGPRNPGEIDWRGYWGNRDVQVRLEQVRAIETLGVQRVLGGWTRYTVGQMRAGIAQLVKRTISADTAPLAYALMIGDRSSWDELLKERIARSGLMHLFAISGLHVGLFVIFAWSLLSFTGLGPRKAALLSLPFLWLLVPLTGGNPPVLRATLIITIAVIGRALQRRSDPAHILALAFILLLFLNPRGLLDPGFQLSFAGATGSIFAAERFYHLMQPVRKYSSRIRRFIHLWSRRLLLIFIVSCAAWLATSPILIASFGRIAWFGPVLTLPALALIYLALTAGWVMVLFAWWPGLAAIYGAAMDVLLRMTLGLSNWSVTVLPDAQQLGMSWVVVALLAIATWYGLSGKIVRAPVAGLSIAALTTAVMILYGSFWLPDPRTEITVIDVGQGDAVLIQGGKRAVLIDGGPEYADDAAQLLRREGITKLDLLLLSHGDADHCGAIPDLADDIEVGSVLVGPGLLRDKAGRDAVSALMENNTNIYYAGRGTRFSSPAGSFTCLHPAPDTYTESTYDNDLSLVWYWSEDGASALWTGDIPSSVERELIADSLLTNVDLLQAAHHGSRYSTSSEWLTTLQPDWVTISCSQRNIYGHPHPDVLDRVARSGAKVARTDESGALLFTVRNGNLMREWW